MNPRCSSCGRFVSRKPHQGHDCPFPGLVVTDWTTASGASAGYSYSFSVWTAKEPPVLRRLWDGFKRLVKG